jgi:two-component system chemotaxis response regulator CheB
VIGVVLTGMLDDGTAGLWAVRDRGGIAIAQSPDEATFPSMPQNAITHVVVDHVVRATELPSLLRELTQEEVPSPPKMRLNGALEIENRIALGEEPLSAGILTLGAPSLNTCPHCHGNLIELADAGPLRFRCHTGHAFSPESLLADLDRTIDDGLITVLRSIHERELLLAHLIEEAKMVDDNETAQEYARQVEDARMRADEIRRLALNGAAQGVVPTGKVKSGACRLHRR